MLCLYFSQGKSASFNTERRQSLSEVAVVQHRDKATKAHRRWVKKNRVIAFSNNFPCFFFYNTKLIMVIKLPWIFYHMFAHKNAGIYHAFYLNKCGILLSKRYEMHLVATTRMVC